MKIHEYQAKELFRKYNIPVPEGQVAFTPDEAVQVAQILKTKDNRYVVKAQIHAGGRGKGGGVKVVDSLDGVREAAKQIIGMQLVTHQTGPEGKKVKSVLVEEASSIARELYISIVLDRATARPVIMASQDGGMDIEEVAEKNPERIIKEFIHPVIGLQPYQARKIAYALNIPAEGMKDALKLITNLYKVFIEADCAMVEINPLVVTTDNRVFALDAKVDFDSNALFRHPDIVSYRDLDEEDPLEVEASRYNLNYIKLEGNVGCLVNGAGLAMATMDIIKQYGAAPANFLDVGGSATDEALENAFRILLSDETVEVVFINIFGGILRCDKLAEGVVKAARKLEMRLPLVIRMKGTNVDLGKQILADSGIQYAVEETLEAAASKVASFLKQPVA
ncbi:ADP-forming succinate--CoA ligase subunit beta [Vampirovibrio chlorellavorus]|uniref:ADP-forming succinate--CoA ligase subunit beta n=1 Tax=Vampirovibrio chlorellavorus TaxID=758823 RepID=UPI0026F104B2|nr:ADP-forming succinate--CoA ligase subunit beta [Vampirovibrio chlorellavorus]